VSARLPTPEEAIRSLLSKQYDTEETAVHAVEEDRARVLARLDAILLLVAEGHPGDAVVATIALAAELRGAS
jgi:hypothetical protein